MRGEASNTKSSAAPARPLKHGGVKDGIPRPIEAVVALAGLVIVAPVLAMSAAAIAVTSPGPVLFRQKRMGRHGKPFTLYKLRTMRVVHEGPQVTAGDDARVTPVGKLLRKTKLDELPELWNILKGDMSIVGPRPEVPRYVDPESDLWRRVLQVRPGLTDPMTLRLRNEELLLANVLGSRERFYLESLQPFKLRGYLEYLQRRNWRSDVQVIAQTLIAIVLPRKAPPPTVQEISAHTENSVDDER
jgi:lipopolysaccharide/colanic/teichoic acid biosynthesis glycosyltransferase